MATTLGASHLTSNTYEVQRTNNFEIHVTLGDTAKENMLVLAVVSGFLPNESNEVISLNYGNTTITVAGKANINGNGSLVVRDFVQVGSDVEATINAWRETVYRKDTDAIGFVEEYKKNAKITQYAPDGTLLRMWDLIGVWPSAVDYGQISYDSPGVKTINITLQYDKAIINREKYETPGLHIYD